MLRTRSDLRPLAPQERDAALELCARDLPANVFVAARILEASRTGMLSSVLAYRPEGQLTSLAWASANIVPVETTPAARTEVADRVRRWRGRSASLFGPRDQVIDLWAQLEPAWGQARAVRAHQPLMVATRPPSALGLTIDERVRPAQVHETDLVVPAAAHMFTAEIGYPPYSGSSRAYRSSIASLIAVGQTYVLIEDGEVVFKTDIGSLALGCAQLQGVWLAPSLRGEGRAAALLGSVLEQLMAGPAPLVSLYVNDYNQAARRLYERLGFRQVGDFTTVLL